MPIMMRNKKLVAKREVSQWKIRAWMPAMYRNEKPARSMPELILRSGVNSTRRMADVSGYMYTSNRGMRESTSTGLRACICKKRAVR